MIPATRGINNAPACNRNMLPITAPSTASAIVSVSGTHAIGGNQTTAGTAACATCKPARRATSEAAAATITTRRYCMNATSCASAPCASAIKTIVIAPPGLKPQRAVLPGKTFIRLSSSPSSALATMTDSEPKTNTGQRPAISPATDNGSIFATMQPMRPCASTKGRFGTSTRPPFVVTRIPATMGPSSNAAGKANHSSKALTAAESPISSSHCSVRFKSGSPRAIMRGSPRKTDTRGCPRK